MPLHAHATATANGVALNAAAGCDNANLDLTLNTTGATREFGQSTNLAGATLDQFEGATNLGNFDGIYVGYGIDVSPAQPAQSLIGAYAYVGESPPAASSTAEFFVLYNCSTRQVLLSCHGAYGTCPRTAQQAAARLAAIPGVPTLSAWGMILTVLVIGAAGGLATRRRLA